MSDLAKLGAISEQKATNLLIRRTRIEFRDDASLRKAWDEAPPAHEADIRNFAAKAAEQGFTAIFGHTGQGTQ